MQKWITTCAFACLILLSASVSALPISDASSNSLSTRHIAMAQWTEHDPIYVQPTSAIRSIGSGHNWNDWKSRGTTGWNTKTDPFGGGTDVPNEGYGGDNDPIDYDVNSVPEPTTLILLGLGLAGLGLRKL